MAEDDFEPEDLQALRNAKRLRTMFEATEI